MGTDNPLANIDSAEVAVQSDDVFNSISTSQSYLPRLQLMTANSDKCKSGEFPINHYARVHDSDYRDLTNTVDILVVAWRPLAIETTDDGGVLTYFDPKVVDNKPTGDFARVQAIADKGGMNGCMYGPQYLVWVPSEQEFMTFLMASKTARRASKSVKARMHEAGTLGSQEIKGKEFTWWGPTCQACTTPFEMPSEEEVKKQMQTFLNPPEPEVEKAEEAGEGAREQ